MNLIVRWCLFARIIKFYISFLSAFHSEKISSMYLFHSSGSVLLRLIISVSTDAIKMFAKATAISVLCMAIPLAIIHSCAIDKLLFVNQSH